MATTKTDTANYRGELFLIGANQTPFLSMIGGLNGGLRSTSFNFPLAQPWSLSSASQDVQSEDTAASAGTPTTITRAQDTNVCQIMKYDAEVTFKKQAQHGTMSGINTTATNSVTNELAFQKMGGLHQMAINIEYSYLNGTYAADTTSASNAATRGITTACTTNTVATGGGALSKLYIDQLLRTMAANGSVFQNSVIFVNGWQKQAISDIYGYAPTDRNVGGLNIQQIETDFAILGIVYAPQMETDELLIADLAFCNPVFVPVNFDGEDFNPDKMNGSDVLWVKTATTAAKKGGFFYTQTGISYGPEEYHGTLTGLKNS